MPVPSKPNALSSYIVMQSQDPEWWDEDDNCPIWVQIEELEKKIVAQKSPGARLIIKKMDSLDDALAWLYEGLENFKPHDHHKSYAADLLVRRYIYLKSQYSLAFLGHVMKEIEDRIEGFHLTPENTRLSPTTDQAASMKAWQHRYRQDKAREARGEHATRRRTVGRRAAKGVSLSASTTKVSTAL